MLKPTVSHYFPWTESDEVAYCGHRMTAADVHSPAPTCLPCAVRQAQEEQAIEDTPLPLDADEARTELDPLLNAGVPARPLSPLGAELFSLATTLRGCASSTRWRHERRHRPPPAARRYTAAPAGTHHAVCVDVAEPRPRARAYGAETQGPPRLAARRGRRDARPPLRASRASTRCRCTSAPRCARTSSAGAGRSSPRRSSTRLRPREADRRQRAGARHAGPRRRRHALHQRRDRAARRSRACRSSFPLGTSAPEDRQAQRPPTATADDGGGRCVPF